MSVQFNPFTGEFQMGSSSGGGGSVTIQPDVGTSPVGTTFTFTSGDGSVVVTGNSGTATVDFKVKQGLAENNIGNSSTAFTADWSVKPNQKITMTGNATATFSNPTAGASYVLKVVQDGTGSRLMTWPGTVKWAGGITPTLSTAASAIDIFSFYYDGTNYFGNYSANYA